MNYRNKETPFEINSEEDWKKVKYNYYVSYICNACGERHIKRVSRLVDAKNTCINRFVPYRYKETPYEIKSEEDWKKVKTDWYVSYICNACVVRHIKKVFRLGDAKNTCIDKFVPYHYKETPYEIKSEEDWKNVKGNWWISYICSECGKNHIKFIYKRKYAKNICLNNIPYRNKETPFEI